jgi:hypothetical protein
MGSLNAERAEFLRKDFCSGFVRYCGCRVLSMERGQMTSTQKERLKA